MSPVNSVIVGARQAATVTLLVRKRGYTREEAWTRIIGLTPSALQSLRGTLVRSFKRKGTSRWALARRARRAGEVDAWRQR